MTVKLLEAIDGLPVGARVSRDYAYEERLVQQGQASRDLTGSFIAARREDIMLGTFPNSDILESSYPSGLYTGFSALVGTGSPYTVLRSTGRGWVAEGAGSVAAEVQNGVAVVQVDGASYALLPVAESGEIVLNFSHRSGTKVDLLSIAGNPNEIAIPSDALGFVVYNGVMGGARFLPRLDSPLALGERSLAFGNNASTTAAAVDAVALGPNAVASRPGEIVFGCDHAGVRRSFVQGYTVTTGDTLGAVGPGGTDSPVRFTGANGLYRVSMTVLARESGTDNFATFAREFTVLTRAANTSPVRYNESTPVPDFNQGLPGCSIGFLDFPSYQLVVTVGGPAASTVHWSLFMDIRAMTTEVGV